jgi:hypothetical protein
MLNISSRSVEDIVVSGYSCLELIQQQTVINAVNQKTYFVLASAVDLLKLEGYREDYHALAYKYLSSLYRSKFDTCSDKASAKQEFELTALLEVRGQRSCLGGRKQGKTRRSPSMGVAVWVWSFLTRSHTAPGSFLLVLHIDLVYYQQTSSVLALAAYILKLERYGEDWHVLAYEC